MTSSHDKFLKFGIHNVTSMRMGTKKQRVISAPALHNAVVLYDATSRKSPSQHPKTPEILWKKEPLKRMLTMMSNSFDDNGSAARPTVIIAPGRQILQLKNCISNNQLKKSISNSRLKKSISNSPLKKSLSNRVMKVTKVEKKGLTTNLSGISWSSCSPLLEGHTSHKGKEG
jgi:hypothetical protein